MDHAYLFPFNLEIDRQQADEAKRVTLDTDYDELLQASHEGRLRCCYLSCLGKVKPVRRDAFDDTDLRCFSHVDPARASVPCPYRDPHEPRETREERRQRRAHNLRKVIENDLRVALEDKLRARGLHASVRGSQFSAPEPCIVITGFGAPFEIRGLAPGCEALWSQPFDGTKDGKPVLFFVLEAEAPKLQQPFLDEHLLRRRPAIVIRPGKEEWETHSWDATSTLRPLPSFAQDLPDLDLIQVDYHALFGIDRAAETLFISTPYREAIERIEKELRGTSAPSQIAALRSFAEWLLVQGGGVTPAKTAPDVEVLLRDPQILRMCSSDATVAAALLRNIAAAARDARAKLAIVEAEWMKTIGQRSALAAAEAKVTELQKKLIASSEEAGRTNEALTKSRGERDALQAKAAKLTDELAAANRALTAERASRAELGTHVLVRIDSWLHH